MVVKKGFKKLFKIIILYITEVQFLCNILEITALKIFGPCVFVLFPESVPGNQIRWQQEWCRKISSVTFDAGDFMLETFKFTQT